VDTKGTEVALRTRRRRHTDEFKSSVVAQCSVPGVSIAAVALQNGLKANLLRR
jgi:transposase-like protein